jgi:hypothetical protein
MRIRDLHGPITAVVYDQGGDFELFLRGETGVPVAEPGEG